MKFVLRVLVCLLLCPPSVFAHTFREKKFTCPIDGHIFKQMMPSSGSGYGYMLDMQLCSNLQSPFVQAQCPQDGFVLYRFDFTEEEIGILRPFVLSPEYQAVWKTETSYWLIAKCMEKLGAPLEKRVWVLLSSTWQADGEQYRRYARETLAGLEAVLAKGEPEKEVEQTTRLLIGELNRRLGDFDRAKEIFAKLANEQEFKENELYMSIIALQLRLIEAGDTASHKVPQIDQPARDKK